MSELWCIHTQSWHCGCSYIYCIHNKHFMHILTWATILCMWHSYTHVIAWHIMYMWLVQGHVTRHGTPYWPFICLATLQLLLVWPFCPHELQVGGVRFLFTFPSRPPWPLPLPHPPLVRRLEVGTSSAHSKKPHWSSLGLGQVKNCRPLLGPSFCTVRLRRGDGNSHSYSV